MDLILFHSVPLKVESYNFGCADIFLRVTKFMLILVNVKPVKLKVKLSHLSLLYIQRFICKSPFFGIFCFEDLYNNLLSFKKQFHHQQNRASNVLQNCTDTYNYNRFGKGYFYYTRKVTSFMPNDLCY